MASPTLRKEVGHDESAKQSKHLRKAFADLLPKPSPRISRKNNTLQDTVSLKGSDGSHACNPSANTLLGSETTYSVCETDAAKRGDQGPNKEPSRNHVRKASVFELESSYKREILAQRRRKISAQEANPKRASRKRDEIEVRKSHAVSTSLPPLKPLKTRKLSLNDHAQGNRRHHKPRRVTLAEYAPSSPNEQADDRLSIGLARSGSDSSISSTGSGSFWFKKLWKEKKTSRAQDNITSSENSKPKHYGLLKRMRQSALHEDMLRAAIFDEDVFLVTRILEQSNLHIDHVRAPGVTLLHEACAIGSVPIIALLLERGASINFRTHSGLSPLMVAAVCGHFEAAQLLLSKGADQECVRNGFQLENRRLAVR